MELIKGTKVKHVKTGVIETIVGTCKIKYNGIWVDGVIYEGNDRYTNEPMTFVRTVEEFEKEFSLWQNILG